MHPSTRTSPDDTTPLGPRQVFHSAEHVALEVPIAGPTSRILAYAIDSVCVGLILAGLVAAALLFTPAVDAIQDYARGFAEQVEQSDTPERQGQMVLYFLALLLVAQFAVEWLYFVIVELVTGGRSIGKAIVGLRVCLDGGLPVTPSATIMRNLLRIVDVLPVSYLTGLASMIVSRAGKRLGDHAAGTIVVRLDRPMPAPPIAVGDEDDPDFRFEREHLAALGADERALLRQTLRRAETLAPEQRLEVIRRTADVLCERLAYRALAPDEAERFLKALFRTSRRA